LLKFHVSYYPFYQKAGGFSWGWHPTFVPSSSFTCSPWVYKQI